MLKSTFILLSVLPLSLLAAVISPDGKLEADFTLNADGAPRYTVRQSGQIVLRESRLGLVRDDADFSQGLTLLGTSRAEPVVDRYEILTAKRRLNDYRANRQVFHLASKDGKKIDVVFQVSNDGVAFRYVFPETSSEIHRITADASSFHFQPDTKAWLQPMQAAKTGWKSTNPAYEECYAQEIPVGTPSTLNAGWAFPALFRSGDTWLLVSEASLPRSYCATRLGHESPDGDYAIAFPDARETMNGLPVSPASTLPWLTPWRFIVIGSLKTITESTLGIDLADKPAVTLPAGSVKPGKASWSWPLLGDGSANFDTQKEFIDYAADMGWAYCLIDAWWDKEIGYEKMKELADYAQTKNVGLLLWYNSNGNWNGAHQTPKNTLLTREDRFAEFTRLKAMGIKGLKIDFFAGDGQPVIAFYHDLLEDAAPFGLLINFHGATLPRGWQRTYPHLMTAEAIRGQEYITFLQPTADQQPTHSAMLPFTRNVFDPMDFTPVVFDKMPRNRQRRTTVGFELALSVLFTSGIQHYAEIPAGMAKVPEYVRDFMKRVPSVWEDTRFIEGYPGKLAVLARRGDGHWYVAGINGEADEKIVTLDLRELPAGSTGQLITDDNGAFSQKTETLAPDGKLTVTLKRHGGFVLVLEPEPRVEPVMEPALEPDFQQRFVHPCIPSTREDLDTIKANLDKHPWNEGYANLARDGHSQLSYTMGGPHANVSRRGRYDQNLGAWRHDMSAVYNLARMWYFTGDSAYAQKSHDILIAWANTQTNFSGNESGLDLGDYAVCYGGGASILRGTWPGWTAADTAAVKSYFSNVLWPAAAGYPVQGPANEGALYLASGMAVAVFCDDTDKFNHVLNMYRTFHGTGLMNTLATGQMGETGRDAGHAYGGLNSLTFIAECAWKQGVDLYSELDNRLLACGEYYARNTFTTNNPYVPFGTIDWQWMNNAAGPYTANRGAFYLLQNAYNNRKNLPTPWIDRKLQEQPIDGGNFMYAKTADATTATVAPASFPAVSLASSGLTLTTLGSQTAGRSAAYANGVWTVSGLGNGVWSDTTDDCQFAYKQMTGDCAMVAKVTSFTKSGSDNGKCGLMIRDNLTTNVSQRGWIGMRWWNSSSTNYMESHMRGWTVNWGGGGYDDRGHLWPPGMPYWVKIERRDKQITTFASPDGTSWSPLNCTYFGNLPSTLYLGLFLCSGTMTVQTATFANVAFTGGAGGLVTTPAAPAALWADASTDSVTVRWLPSFGATAYDLLCSTTPGSGYTVIATNLTTAKTSYVDTAVRAGGTYTYAVRAKNTAGTSRHSPPFGAALLPPPMVSLAFTGSATASFNGDSEREGAHKAFDRDPGSKWYGYNAPTGWLQYAFDPSNAQVVKRYTVNNADVPARDPKDWKFLGSLNGVSWTVLDSRRDQSFRIRMGMNTYDIGNATAYRYYRLNITTNNGAPGVAIGELGLWAAERAK